MKVLPKKQRNQIYQKALKDFISHPKGLCVTIAQNLPGSVESEYWSSVYSAGGKSRDEYWPEFGLFFKSDNVAWLDLPYEDVTIRETILCFTIAMTN